MTRTLARCVPLLLLVSLTGRLATAQEQPAREVIRVRVQTDAVIARTSSHFIGLGYETSAVAHQGYFSPRNTHLVQLLRTLSPHGLIRIGGNISDHTKFVADGTPVVASERETTIINQAELDELGEFLRATGWQAMWGLNLASGTPDQAAQEAAAVRKALGDRLQSLEIGNETDLQPRFRKNYDAYFAEYQRYKSAIRAKVPDAAFSGPDAASGVEWLRSFAKTESKDLELLTRHYYRGGAGSPDATIGTLLAPDAKWEAQLDALQKISSASGVPFRINEINSFFGGGKPGVSDTFASALWCLDTMGLLASHGCDGVNMETDINQHAWVSHYSPIFRDDAGRLSARPEYYGMLAFSVAGLGDVLKTSRSATDVNVTAYATKNPKGELWVIVVNKDPSKPAAIALTVPSPHLTADCLRLSAPSGASPDHVTLGGADLAPDGSWSAALSEAIPVKDGTASFPVPATSAALIRLR